MNAIEDVVSFIYGLSGLNGSNGLCMLWIVASGWTRYVTEVEMRKNQIFSFLRGLRMGSVFQPSSGIEPSTAGAAETATPPAWTNWNESELHEMKIFFAVLLVLPAWGSPFYGASRRQTRNPALVCFELRLFLAGTRGQGEARGGCRSGSLGRSSCERKRGRARRSRPSCLRGRPGRSP